MKNKIIITLLLAMPMIFASCLSDQEDVFDQASSERLEKALAEAKEILVSAEEGWLMDYYYGEEYAYGGIPFIMTFDDTNVTISSVEYPEGATSYYKMATHNGPVLSLDLYNKVLHSLSQASQDRPDGYQADFEFTIMKATPELIVLRGLRTGNTCYLRPFKGNKEVYLNAVKQMSDDILVSIVEGTVDGAKFNATMNLDALSMDYSVEATDKVYSGTTSYVYTDKGIRLCQPITIGTKTIQDFSFDSNTEKFTSLETENAGVSLQAHLPEGYVKFEEFAGDYQFVYMNPNSGGQWEPQMIEISLVPSADGTHYLMKGLHPLFDLKLNFNKTEGSLTLPTQKVGTYSGFNVYFQGISYEEGFYPTLSALAVKTQKVKTDEGTIFQWVSTENEYEIIVDTFILGLVDDSNTWQGQLYNVADWQFTGGINSLFYVTGLIKID